MKKKKSKKYGKKLSFHPLNVVDVLGAVMKVEGKKVGIKGR